MIYRIIIASNKSQVFLTIIKSNSAHSIFEINIYYNYILYTYLKFSKKRYNTPYACNVIYKYYLPLLAEVSNH